MPEITLSLFQGYSDTYPVDKSLTDIVEMILHDPHLADNTAKHRYCRQNGWTKDATRTKMACPCFAVAVRFSQGKKRENISGWTHLCLVDFDHIPPEKKEACLQLIRQDPHTLLTYTTISKEGIRIICPYICHPDFYFRNETELYKLAFEKINRHYAALIGHEYDEKCKNITRLSGLAHDPEAWYCENALPFEIEAPASLLDETKSRKKQERLQKVVYAIRTHLADKGVEYTDHQRNNYIMRTGYLFNAYGVDQQTATAWGVKQFADYDGDVAGIFRSCYRKTDEYGTLKLPSHSGKKSSPNDAATSVVSDIEAFLSTQGRFRKNTITRKCEMAETGSDKFSDLTDRMVNTLWCRMSKEVRSVRQQDLRAVIDSEFVELYNPFVRYLDSLEPWDGKTDHIAALAAQVHVTTGKELFPVFFKKWLVAMVASLLDENVVNHEILVLIGRQGIYKTTWLNNLLPPHLRKYFYLKSNSRNISKDDLLTLSEFAIVCLEELDEMEGREVNQLKALTTMRHVNERAAYAHYKENRPHIASLCGTGNNLHFLTDLTGNRRWMPFEVESIDNPYLNQPDYEGVYAQAHALLQGGFHFWLEKDETEALNLHNKYFEVPCIEKELIQVYFRRPKPGDDCSFLSNSQIMMRLESGIRHKLSAVKIGQAMKQEGYESVRKNGKRGYRVIELSWEAIEQNKKSLAIFTEEPEPEDNPPETDKNLFCQDLTDKDQPKG